MKKFIIIYSIVTLLFGFAVYYVTNAFANAERFYELSSEFAAQSVEEENFDPFLDWQSIAYKKIFRETTDDYWIDGYLVVLADEDEGYNTVLAVFVVPNKDIKYATEQADSEDETGLRLIDNATRETLFESYTDQKEAVSYQLTVLDFYFYSVDFDKDIETEIELYDYKGDLIASRVQVLTKQDYPSLEGDFKEGMDIDAKYALIDEDTYVRPKVIKNVLIFSAIDIVLGVAIYVLIYKRHMTEDSGIEGDETQ